MGQACCQGNSLEREELLVVPVEAGREGEKAVEELEAPSTTSTADTEDLAERPMLEAPERVRLPIALPIAQPAGDAAPEPEPTEAPFAPQAALPAGEPAQLVQEEAQAAPVAVTLPPELIGCWRAVPGSLDGLDGLLTQLGVRGLQRRLAETLARRASPKLVISRGGTSGAVAVTSHSGVSISGGTDVHEFKLDGSPFKASMVDGDERLHGEGRGCLIGTTLVLRVQHAQGSRTSEWQIESGHLWEVVRHEKRGKGEATVTRRYERSRK